MCCDEWVLGPGDVERDWEDEAWGDEDVSESTLVVEPARRRLKKPILAVRQLSPPEIDRCVGSAR